MPIDLQGGPPIVHGWGQAPDLRAPGLGELVSSILKNRQYQQEYTHRDIADAIKQFQNQREEQAYLEAAQKAGLVPEGDLGYGGKYGTALAKLIQDKREADARAAHLAALTAHVGSGRGGGGRGEAGYPETTWDDQGREWRRGPSGRWIPVAPVKTQQTPGTPKLSPTERGWAAPEIPGVSVDINAPDQPGTTLQPDVPPMPEPPAQDTTMPPGVKYVPGPSGPQTGSAGTTDVIRLRAEAQDAIARGADPDKVRQRFHDQTGGVL